MSKALYYQWLTDPTSKEKYLVVMLERDEKEGAGVDLITLKITKKNEHQNNNQYIEELEYAEVAGDHSTKADNFINKILQQINVAFA
jgi:hypothetical protein